jgi:rhodanese-related sulfurtransferase
MATIDQLLDAARARLTRVTAAEAAQALADGAVLVDIRAESQIARSGSIPGAIVTPRNVLEWRADPASETHDARLSQRTGPLILFCAEGYQSSLAAATLHDLGIADATDLIDGFDGWIAAGLPIEPGQDSGVPM